MKKLLALVFFQFASVISFAQNDSVQINRIYEHIFDDMVAKKYATAFDYMYPKFFDHVPREMIEKAMIQSMEQENMEIGFLENEVLSIQPFYQKDGVNYQKVKYRTKMYMRFTDDTLSENDTTSVFNVKDLMLVSLNKSFGADNVVFDDKTDTFYIDAQKDGMAILDPAYEGWKIVNVEKNMTPILEKMFPQEVLDAFFDQ